MSKTTRPAAGARAGRDRLDELKKAQQAKERRTRLVLITSVATVILLIAGVVGFAVWRDVSTRPTLDAVKEYTVTRDHTTEAVTYEQTPPVGGNHHPTWLNCGVYTEPVQERARRALHGARRRVGHLPQRPAGRPGRAARRPGPRHVHGRLPHRGPDRPRSWRAPGGPAPSSPGSTTPASRSSSRSTARAADARAGASCSGGSDGAAGDDRLTRAP